MVSQILLCVECYEMKEEYEWKENEREKENERGCLRKE
jgi:hypothetical protein